MINPPSLRIHPSNRAVNANFRRHSGSGWLAAIGAAMLVAATAAMPAPADPPPGYSLTWSEEFNEAVGSFPNTAVWSFIAGSNEPNNELETYVRDPKYSHIVADPDATDGRALQILATSDGNGDYYSVRMHTGRKVTAQYGYIEARIKLPYSQGVWPAFWMLGSDIRKTHWPACGEIDIMEAKGSEPSINHGSLHGPGFSGAKCLSDKYTLPNNAQFKDAYHTFAILWSENSITFYVDGNPYETRTPADTSDGAWPYNKPLFFLLNLAIGGDFTKSPDKTSVFPQKMLVDYIRVYQYTATTPHNGPHAVPGTLSLADFDNGGEGVAFHNPGAPAAASAYRSDAVSLSPASDSTYALAPAAPGQWLKYSVQVDKTAAYDLAITVASEKDGGTFHIEDVAPEGDGVDVTGPIQVASTGGDDKWTTVHATADLPAGFNVLKLVEDTGAYSLGRVTFMTANDIVSGATYKLVDTATTNCLTGEDHATKRKTALSAPYDPHSNSYRWTVSASNGYYTLKNKETGLCLTSGDTPDTTACDGGDNQLWAVALRADGSAALRSKADGRAVIAGALQPSPPSTAPGQDSSATSTPLATADPSSSSASAWTPVLLDLPWQP